MKRFMTCLLIAGMQASTSSASSLEEVTVTATRGQQRVLDSAATLSIISAEDLQRSTAHSLAEMMRDVPGVQVTDSGQPGLSRVRLRGEESRRTAILVNSQEVTDHYEVGTPLTLHPAMLERIEVMRGSGAVLYGSRALSGVVNFITRKGGTEPLQGTVSGSYASATEGNDWFASVYGKAGEWAYRVAYADSDHDERNTPQGEIENTRYDNSSSYVFLGRSFGDHHLEVTWEDFESSSEIFVEEEVRTTPPLTDFYLEAPQRDREKIGLFYNWDLNGNWLDKIEANMYHQESDRHFYTRSALTMYERDINNFSELTTDGALLQFDFQPLGRDHHLIAGLQYNNDDVDQTRHVDTDSFVPYVPSGISIIDDEASIETWAWYVQDQWDITGELTLTAGLRQYFVDGELEDTSRDSLEAGQLDDDDEVIAALGLVWSYSDHARLRLNVSEGYVYPSLAQLATGAYAGSRFVNPNLDLNPETSINYEMGWRYQGGPWLIDLTAFYTESDDYIHHLPCEAEDNCPGSRDRLYQNVGESRAHGSELYLAWLGVDNALNPYLNLTWMKRRNEYEAFSTWDSGIPEVSGRLGLRWQGQVGSFPLWIDTYMRGEGASELEEPGTVRNVLEDKGSWVTFNAAAGLDFGAQQQYQLVLELHNLGDETYIASTENLYGPERAATVKFSANW